MKNVPDSTAICVSTAALSVANLEGLIMGFVDNAEGFVPPDLVPVQEFYRAVAVALGDERQRRLDRLESA